MQLNSSAMRNILLGRHFDLPVCFVGDKHYIVARAHTDLPLGLILEITDLRQRLLGEFYVIDWEAELLERVMPSKPFRDAVKALREDEVFDFEPAFSHIDINTIMLYVAEKVLAERIQGIEPVAALAGDFYDKCLVAEALDLRMLNDTLPSLCAQYGVSIATDYSLSGWREPAIRVALLMAHELIEGRKNN